MGLISACSSHQFDTSIHPIDQLKAPYSKGRFTNLYPFDDKSFWQVMKWKLRASPQSWDIKSEESGYLTGVDDPTRISENIDFSTKLEHHMAVTHLQHSTVLIQFPGLNILTDPMFSERASPVSWLGPRRQHDLALEISQLPPIDIILISHNHYDHLDLPSIAQLIHDNPKIKILTGLGNKKIIEKGLKIQGIDICDMDWWDQEFITEQLSITFAPAHHWSARGMFDRFKTLWGSFSMTWHPSSKSIYFGGDTGYSQHFHLIRERFGPQQYVILPIGAYEPRWFMKSSHMNPTEALLAAQELGAQWFLGVHWGSFQLTDEGRFQPLRSLERALERAQSQLAELKVAKPLFGETIILNL